MASETVAPDSTAVRVALWRALHLELDAPPFVLEDEIGLKIADPPSDWRDRGDMHPQGTKSFRASIVGRARYIEDLVVEQYQKGVAQYVILGAGLDSFALRRPELASGLIVFEVDRPGPQEWKKRRLKELGMEVPESLRFVPVDFETGDHWWRQLVSYGFDASRPAVVTSTGVSMYLTKDANRGTMAQVAELASGSTFAMTFLMPFDVAEPELQPVLSRAEQGARASGTPFVSFYTPQEIVQEGLAQVTS